VLVDMVTRFVLIAIKLITPPLNCSKDRMVQDRMVEDKPYCCLLAVQPISLHRQASLVAISNLTHVQLGRINQGVTDCYRAFIEDQPKPWAGTTKVAACKRGVSCHDTAPAAGVTVELKTATRTQHSPARKTPYYWALRMRVFQSSIYQHCRQAHASSTGQWHWASTP